MLERGLQTGAVRDKIKIPWFRTIQHERGDLHESGEYQTESGGVAEGYIEQENAEAYGQYYYDPNAYYYDPNTYTDPAQTYDQSQVYDDSGVYDDSQYYDQSQGYTEGTDTTYGQ